MKVPAFLLKRLYQKGSLRNTAEGFAFALKNTLGSGYAHAMLPLKVDGAELPLSATVFHLDGKTISFAEVTKEAPFTLAMNREIGIAASGLPLASGPHVLTIGFTVVGLGDLTFEVVDSVR